MNMKPRVSVLMPVRNGMPWLQEALEGLARQTLGDIEILVLEDGSTDGTRACLASWRDDRVRVIHAGGIGMAAALNLGLEAARAPLVARHDADDVSAPERLEEQLEYMVARTDVGVVATVADYIDANGQPVENDWVRTVRRQQDVAQRPHEIAALMPLTCCITHGSVMARTGVLRVAGGYRQNTWPAEDYDLWLRLLPRTPIAKLPHRLYRYRLHDAQVSAQAREQQLVQTLSAKFRYVRRLFPQLPSPARVVISGTGRGAACYRALAAAHGFQPIPPASGLQQHKLALLNQRLIRQWALDTCDALIVANFADLDAYESALLAGDDAADALRVGNFFIPRRWAARQAA